MSVHAVVIGAGMGGLAAALRLRNLGHRVTVIEARSEPGGLAAGITREGFALDGGPYILLDRPGLSWAFSALGLELSDLIELRRIDEVYEVTWDDGARVSFHADLGRTAEGIERSFPGAGKRYERFVAEAARVHEKLRPMLQVSRPGLGGLLRSGAWAEAPFLLRSLGAVLRRAELPPRVADAIAIWTHIARQRVDEAPSPMAFVPALIHTEGAYYAVGGTGAIPRALAAAIARAGVEIRLGTRVASIRCEHGRAVGVETEGGELVSADVVVSNHSGVGTYLDLLRETPDRARRNLSGLPLQSPGVCAYLAVKGEMRPPYLRFRLPPDGEPCRGLVLPGVMDSALVRAGEWPARLLAPMGHADAERLGPEGQRAFLDAILAEPWWRDLVGSARVIGTRIPVEWGAEYTLHRDSMNPVMTAAFMRRGRLAHRSPHAARLYLAGSATHPGQWVSFCAISGVLAADLAHEDLG